MRLARTAMKFNLTPCHDAYTGVFLFNGQPDVYSEGVRDGVATQRRVLELDPSYIPPARGVLTYGGQTWIVGMMNVDTFKGQVIRHKYAMHEADNEAARQYAPASLFVDAYREAFMGAVWSRTIKEVEQSSVETNQLTLYFHRGEPISEGDFIVAATGETYLVKEPYPATAGHLGVIVEQLELEHGSLIQSGQLWGDKDPFTQQEAELGPIDYAPIRWQGDFVYYSLATPTFVRGDEQWIAPEATDVPTGARIETPERSWRVISVQHRRNAQYLHMRRI